MGPLLAAEAPWQCGCESPEVDLVVPDGAVAWIQGGEPQLQQAADRQFFVLKGDQPV